MSLVLTPEAERDLIEAKEWLHERSPQLPLRFAEVLDSTFREITEFPEGFPVVHRGMRRALTRTFPYGVFYTVEAGEVVVHGVIHQARHPAVWLSRP
jgi:toxin ParE1/3/4